MSLFSLTLTHTSVCCPGTAVEFRYRRVGPVRSSGEKWTLQTLNARIYSMGEFISRLRASSHSFSLSGSCSGNVWKIKLSSCDNAVGRSRIAFSRLKHPGKAHTRTIAGEKSNCDLQGRTATRNVKEPCLKRSGTTLGSYCMALDIRVFLS